MNSLGIGRSIYIYQWIGPPVVSRMIKYCAPCDLPVAHRERDLIFGSPSYCHVLHVFGNMIQIKYIIYFVFHL